MPPAYFNGYLEGWSFVFLLAYHYFFFNANVRKHRYGDYFSRTHDPKWDANTPFWSRVLFGVKVVAGHWLAAFEGPQLHRLLGGWVNVRIWVLIVVTMLMHLRLNDVSSIRYMLLLCFFSRHTGYCTVLPAPLSMLFLVAVSLVYYNKKAKLEEEMMVESFGQSNPDYADKVRHKFHSFCLLMR